MGGLVSPFAHFDLARSDDVKLKHNSQSSVSSLIPSLGRTCLEMWTRVGHVTVRCMGNTHTPAEVDSARLTAAISLTCVPDSDSLFIPTHPHCSDQFDSLPKICPKKSCSGDRTKTTAIGRRISLTVTECPNKFRISWMLIGPSVVELAGLH